MTNERRRGGWRGAAKSLEALDAHRPYEPLARGMVSAAVRVACAAGDLRWWRRLTSAERGRIVAQARAAGWTGAADGDRSGGDWAE